MFRSRSQRAALVAAVTFLVGAGVASGAAHTQVIVYETFDASGTPTIAVAQTIKGSCFSGSSAARRRDAWRCMSGNRIYDPCFSAHQVNFVLCPIGAPAVKIKLTKPLPGKFANRRKASTSGLPWALRLTSGATCRFLNGATSLVDHRRADYACGTSKNLLWGSPIRSTEPWTIFSAPFTTKRLTSKVAIKTAWF